MRSYERLKAPTKACLVIFGGIIATLIAGLPAAPAGDAGSSPTADRSAFDAAHQAFAAAEVRKDVDAMLQTWSDDIVLMPPGKDPVYGKESVAKYLDPLRQSKHRVLSERFETTDLRIEGDIAYEVGHVIGEEQAPGAAVSKYRTKYLSVWKRQADGRWQICRDMWDFLKVE